MQYFWLNICSRWLPTAWLFLGCSTLAAAQSTESGPDVAAGKYLHTLLRETSDGANFSYTYLKNPYMNEWSKKYRQYHSITKELEEETLTIADQLNGIEWKGTLHLHFSASRSLYESFDSNSTTVIPTCWTDWQSEPSDVLKWSAEKKNGQWNFYSRYDAAAASAFGPEETAPDENDIPRILKFAKCSDMTHKP